MRDFLKDLEVVSVKEYFFIRNEVAYLTLIIKYFPVRQELDNRLNPKGQRDEAWRKMLSEGGMGLFNLLRDWRAKRAKKEGLPPYILFTNMQFAQNMVTKFWRFLELILVQLLIACKTTHI